MRESRWLVQEGSYCRHSEAYRWLRSQHDEIDAFLKAKCASFAYVVAEIKKDGIKGTKGQDLGYQTLIHLWRRVRRDVALDAATKSASQSEQTPVEPPGPNRPPKARSDAASSHKYH